MVFGNKSPPGKVRTGCDDKVVSVDQAEAFGVAEHVVRSPAATSPVEVADKDAEIFEHEGPDSSGHQGRFPILENPDQPRTDRFRLPTT